MRALIATAGALGALAAGLIFQASSLADACAGLIGSNGAVNLGRTTTFAAYHDGVEHYVTAFSFQGGGGQFGSIVPLPGIPTKVERGGDWTLQRLVQETQPQPVAFEALVEIWAAELGRAIAERGWELVWGGGRFGLMGALSRAAREAGGRTLGIILQDFIDKNVHCTSAHQMESVADMRSRKQGLDEAGDAFIALPGGLGTLEELLEAPLDAGTFEILADSALVLPADDGGQWRFAHALIHDAAYAGLLASRRRALHARLADRLELRGGVPAPGQIAVRPGPVMAATDEVVITVRGKGGHGAMPHLTVDPVVAAAQIIAALQTIASRNTSPLDAVVVSVCSMETSQIGVFNVIPDFVKLIGTVRSFRAETRDLAEKRVAEINTSVYCFDGRRLDDLIDFLTYTLLPLFLLCCAGVLPEGHEAWLLPPLIASAYGFSQQDAKTEDDFFLGFPSYWNVVALYVWLLDVAPVTARGGGRRGARSEGPAEASDARTKQPIANANPSEACPRASRDPGSAASARTSGVGSAPTTRSRAAGTSSDSKRL